jgi:hypothetical protein
VHHRIPNFVDAELAAQRLTELPEFQAAQLVKVNPDTPQKQVGGSDAWLPASSDLQASPEVLSEVM